MKKTLLATLVLTALSASAQAATRTVCLRLSFKDNRASANCATTGETGNERGCAPGNDVDHLGAVVELWDKDSDGSDEKLGRFVYTTPNGTCWTFEWDNNSTANAEHEANPDVYPKYVNEVKNTGNTRSVVAKKSDGSSHSAVTWRNGRTGEPDRYVASECKTGTQCWILPGGGWLLPATDVNTDVAKRAMVLDSAQHGLEIFAGIMTSTVNIRVPDTTGTCSTACTTSRTNIQLPDVFTSDGIRVVHELGHAVQMQVFAQDTLRDDCSKNGAGWNLTSVEFDSCATQEGVATYAGLASWYDGGVANTNPNVWGFTFETATPNASTCSANRGLALQVAKSYWDMDDVTNEVAVAPAAMGDDDGDAWFPLSIMQGYNQFPAGTANRQKSESDSNGLNVRDYVSDTNVNWFGGSATQTQTMLNHNCIQSQDNG